VVAAGAEFFPLQAADLVTEPVEPLAQLRDGGGGPGAASLHQVVGAAVVGLQGHCAADVHRGQRDRARAFLLSMTNEACCQLRLPVRCCLPVIGARATAGEAAVRRERALSVRPLVCARTCSAVCASGEPQERAQWRGGSQPYVCGRGDLRSNLLLQIENVHVVQD
jgi:hypothetical protein